MTQATKTDNLKKLNNLEKMVKLILEEIRKMKGSITNTKIKKDPLYGLLKDVKITDEDIEEAKKIWNYRMD